MKSIAGRENLGVLLVAMLVVGLGWFAYKPALSGSFLLDDESNLAELQNVEDVRSAMRFVFSGSAGPVGRPLALASFVPQAGYWESGAGPFLAVNVLLHLFNAVLLGWFFYRLSLIRGIDARDARFAALTAMALWLFMPLLASASLMVVQRMTTLSATFVLIGLNVYLAVRQSAVANANRALIGMTLAICLAGVLSILVKENGILLPVLVLVMELTILQRPDAIERAKWRRWCAVVLVLPTAALIGYLATRVPYSEEMVLLRDFNAWERLLTQSHVLWEYLLHAFAPRPGRFGPYHDGYPIAREFLNPTTMAAVCGWVLAAISAIIWRRRYPVAAFAALWFLAGHLLESTTIPLEMYFEHRNYIPIIGPVFALCYVATRVPAQYRLLARVGLSLYILVNALFLFSQATMWGDPAVATRFWHAQSPGSVRAATAMATEQLSLEGPAGTLRTLREFAEDYPKHAYIRIPELSLSCIIAPQGDHQPIVQSLADTLPKVSFSYTAGQMLSDLISTTTSGNCNDVDEVIVADLASKLSSNPRYRDDKTYQQYHQQLMAQLARHRDDTRETLKHLRRAIELKPSTELNMMVVTTLVSEGRFDEARAHIEEAKLAAPMHPFKRYLWISDLAELLAYTDEVEGSFEEEKGARIDQKTGAR